MKALSITNKKFLILSLIVILAWTLSVFRIDIDVITRDQFPWVLEFEAFMKGDYELSKYWEAKGGHRLPGYKLLFFLNCWLFGFSPKLEIMSAIIPFSIAGSYVAIKFSEALNFKKAAGVLVLLAFALLCFNAQSFRMSNYSLIATQLADYAGFILVAGYAYSIAFTEGPAFRSMKWLIFALLVLIFILGFGRGYGVGAAASIICLCLAAYVKDRDNKNLLIVTAILGVSIPIYLIGISSKGSAVAGSFDFAALIKYMVIKYGDAHMGMFSLNSFSKYPVVPAVLGAFLLLLTGVIILRFLLLERPSRADWLAMFMILMSLFSLLLVSVLRYDQSPFFPRHNLEVALGFVGVLYFVLKEIKERLGLNSGQKAAAIIGAALCLTLTVHHVMNVNDGKYVRNYYDRIKTFQQNAYVSETPLEKSDYREMLCPMSAKKCHRAFGVFKEYGMFEDRPGR